MYNGIIATDDEALKNECEQIVKFSGDINLCYYPRLQELNLNGSYLKYLFIIVTEIDASFKKKAREIQARSPKLPIILYNHSITLSSISMIPENTDIRLIIGDGRQETLALIMHDIKKEYWRTIPADMLNIDERNLSERIKSALRYIESCDICDCNVTGISRHLNISAGYFSQEFKREMNISFREFMQKILNYYEDIIISQVDLPAKNISAMLGYSELSSFSRSFKKRKGVSPTQYKKQLRT